MSKHWTPRMIRERILEVVTKYQPCTSSTFCNAMPSCPSATVRYYLGRIIDEGLITKTPTHPAEYFINTSRSIRHQLYQMGAQTTPVYLPLEPRMHYHRGHR